MKQSEKIILETLRKSTLGYLSEGEYSALEKAVETHGITNLTGATAAVIKAAVRNHPTFEAPAIFQKVDCPTATKDIAVNLKNRETAIKTAKYGPLNPAEANTEFWNQKAARWEVTIAEAKKSICGNCAAFNKSPEMLNCIKDGLAQGDSRSNNEFDTINAGDLGYCESFDFKCAAARTCDAWISGGPVTKATGVKQGDMVSWNSSGGTARGKVVRVVRSGKLSVPKTNFEIDSQEDDPAVLIQLYRDGNPTDTQVGHKMSTLRKS